MNNTDNLGTQIESWQMKQSFNDHPFFHVWYHKLNEAMIHEFKWIDDINNSYPNYSLWIELKQRLCSVLKDQTDYMVDLWNHIPDKDQQSLWECKGERLKQFYISLHYTYEKFNYPTVLSDIYREKTDQAIDYLAKVNQFGLLGLQGTDIPPLIKDFFQPTDTRLAYHNALDIVKKRTEWLQRLEWLERTRITTTSHIINSKHIPDINAYLVQGINALEHFFKKWI